MFALHLRVTALRSVDGVDLRELRSIEMGKDAFVFSADRGDSTLVMASVALGKEAYGLPAQEQRVSTNFIR